MVRRSSRRTKRFRSSPRNKHLCDLKPRSKYCKKKEDKVKPYSGGKLNTDEICHNCTEGAYAKGARRFCKTHGKIWDPKSNSCRKKKKKQTKKSGTKSGTESESNKESKKIKYNKYSKCLEKCELKEKNKKHVCTQKCKKYKKYKKYKTIETKKNNSSEIIKEKIQTGGALCLPCISPILSGLGVMGAGAVATGAVATGAVATGAATGAIKMTSSKMSQSGKNFEREQSFEKNISKTHKKSSSRKGKIEKLKFHIKQKNNVVTYKINNGKLKKKVFKGKNMKDTIKKATKFYNNKIKYCVTRGYKKC